MEQEYVLDFERIFFGNLPWLFLVEICVRTLIIYVYALCVVHVLGKRGMGQLAPFDFVIIIALGSAVGDPMFYPSVPLLHAMVAITGIVLLTRGLVHVTERHRRLKDFVSTTPTRLVVDGCLDLDGMHEERISRGELFQSLRSAGVRQLGEVERAYLEPSGGISTFLLPPPERKPGLPLLPEGKDPPVTLREVGAAAPESRRYACHHCGNTVLVQRGDLFDPCRAAAGGVGPRP